jgi:hypothetical protein
MVQQQVEHFAFFREGPPKVRGIRALVAKPRNFRFKTFNGLYELSLRVVQVLHFHPGQRKSADTALSMSFETASAVPRSAFPPKNRAQRDAHSKIHPWASSRYPSRHFAVAAPVSSWRILFL